MREAGTSLSGKSGLETQLGLLAELESGAEELVVAVLEAVDGVGATGFAGLLVPLFADCPPDAELGPGSTEGVVFPVDAALQPINKIQAPSGKAVFEIL